MKTIDEYIATEMVGTIVRKRKSPVVGLLVLAAGVVLLVLVRRAALADALMAAMLMVGLVCVAVGLVVSAMCLTGALSGHVYKPTGSPLRQRHLDLSAEDYGRCVEAIGKGDMAAVGRVQPVSGSNSVLHLMYSRDRQVALLQVGRYDTGHFEPTTEVAKLVGTEIAAINSLCK